MVVLQTDEQAPLPGALSQLLERVKSGYSKAGDFIFNCQMGRGRTTTGMITACLIATTMTWKEHNSMAEVVCETITEEYDSIDGPSEEEAYLQGDLSFNFAKNMMTAKAAWMTGEYKTILQLVGVLAHGKLAKRLTDRAVDLMQDVQNLRKAIYDNKLKVDACEKGTPKHQKLFNLAVNYLYRYGTLIVFANYLIEMRETPEEETTFPAWLSKHREITKLLATTLSGNSTATRGHRGIIVVTGSNGSVGRAVVANALKQGHIVLGVDQTPDRKLNAHPRFGFKQVDLRDFDETLKVLEGFEGVAHLAAFPNPTDYLVKSHNRVFQQCGHLLERAASRSIFATAVKLGINRVAAASTANVITMVYSQKPHFEYFPIDEDHPCLPDEPYGLSKLCATFIHLLHPILARCKPIPSSDASHPCASRVCVLHWCIPTREKALKQDPMRAKNDLWGWVQEDSAAEAFLLALTQDDGRWSGHERFFITAPDRASLEYKSEELKEAFWGSVKIREEKEISGRMGFFDCSKAERLLGWVHRDVA
ncbi:hypothetical protein EW146_g7374 [Bondarzewia mesenterica]|uniref:NAD-dependent epimerase/dehydratase domain-containing protein n=1 Tax=Bondarzewia mesenterica TaxID=1095465 RepID=A0A4S4LLH4_9AGAM|nr:hypothetical protein EW146_g7374 [Bondarzewia mesenterica]